MAEDLKPLMKLVPAFPEGAEAVAVVHFTKDEIIERLNAYAALRSHVSELQAENEKLREFLCVEHGYSACPTCTADLRKAEQSLANEYANAARLIAWMASGRPANTAFTEGPERQVAYAIEGKLTEERERVKAYRDMVIELEVIEHQMALNSDYPPKEKSTEEITKMVDEDAAKRLSAHTKPGSDHIPDAGEKVLYLCTSLGCDHWRIAFKAPLVDGYQKCPACGCSAEKL